MDRWVIDRSCPLIPEKRLPHKRAFILNGVMVELFLVQRDEKGYYTDFWGHARHRWPGQKIVTVVKSWPLATPEVLESYRTAYAALRAARAH